MQGQQAPRWHDRERACWWCPCGRIMQISVVCSSTIHRFASATAAMCVTHALLLSGSGSRALPALDESSIVHCPVIVLRIIHFESACRSSRERSRTVAVARFRHAETVFRVEYSRTAPYPHPAGSLRLCSFQSSPVAWLHRACHYQFPAPVFLAPTCPSPSPGCTARPPFPVSSVGIPRPHLPSFPAPAAHLPAYLHLAVFHSSRHVSSLPEGCAQCLVGLPPPLSYTILLGVT